MMLKIRHSLSTFKAMSMLLGPAFVAAIAYVDPGNFATNLGAGAKYGYMLLWVLVLANLMASLVQYLSAKTGLVTGKSLPEIVRDRLSRRVRVGYWFQAELVAIATDIAEVVGGAIALNLLFDLPLLIGGIITSIISLFLLIIQKNESQQMFERVIIGLLLIIPIGFIVGLFMHPPDPAGIVGGLVPQFSGAESVLLAVGMIGATVMPHVVYLHSALARDRHGKIDKNLITTFLKATKIDIGLAMFIAGGVNILMLLLAASALYGQPNTTTLTEIHQTLGSNLGGLIATLFAISLLISGLASTSVGCYAGSVIMDGLLNRKIPILLRRLITLIPAVFLLAIGVDPTFTLVLSQVALSFGIPFAIVPLIMITSNKKIMGDNVNNMYVTSLAWLIALIVIALNILLVVLTIKELS